MSGFDLEKFKASAVHDSTASSFTVKDKGWHGATIVAAELADGKERDDGSAWARYSLTMNFDDRDRRRMSMFVELLVGEDGNAIVDPKNSKNIPFGQLREAIGKNAGNFHWGDPEGHHVQVEIGHRLGNDGKTYEEPKGFRKG